jgi:hypothetical protein
LQVAISVSVFGEISQPGDKKNNRRKKTQRSSSSQILASYGKEIGPKISRHIMRKRKFEITRFRRFI